MWCRLISLSIAGIVLVALLQAFAGAAEPVSDEFVLADRVSSKAFPENVPLDTIVQGSRFYGSDIAGSTVVTRVNSGGYEERGTASRDINMKCFSLVLLNIKTEKFEVYAITPALVKQGREFGDVSVSSGDMIDFSTCNSRYATVGDSEEEDTCRWYRRNLRTGGIQSIEKPDAGDYGTIVRTPKATAMYGAYSHLISPEDSSKFIVVSYDADREDALIKLDHAPFGLQDVSTPLEERYPASNVTHGDERGQLIVCESSAGTEGTCSITAYNLDDVSIKWRLTQEQLEQKLGRTGCVAIITAHGTKYPCPRSPMSIVFQDGSVILASIAQGKVEWMTELKSLPRWKKATASADGRFVALSWEPVHLHRVVLLDCVKQTISPPSEVNPQHRYSLQHVSVDGDVVLQTNDGIGVLRCADGKWSLKHHQILELAE